MCPGKKDCFSIRNKHGSKGKVQKRFLLAKISEIYANFKAKFPSLKIEFSTFFSCSLFYFFPPVGVARYCNVYVCTYHQNVKLVLNIISTSLSCKDVLKLCICSTENSYCMLHHCNLCPEQTRAHNFLKEQLLLNYMIEDLIKYKQWFNTNRSNLGEHKEDFNDFLDKLTSLFFELTEHHFIAKKTK